MSRKSEPSISFGDLAVDQLVNPKHRLMQIDELIDWSGIEFRLRLSLVKSRGRPPYPPLQMFKALLLQVWYNLSDEGLEDSLLDRLSFRRFCGLKVNDPTPDAITIGRFRASLKREGEKLFEAINSQLDKKGMMVKSGTLVDATIIQAAVNPPSKGNQVSSKDGEAGWAVKNNDYTFGYKAHLGVDEESGLIRKARLTDGSLHDSLGLGACVSGDEAAVYADKAYDSRALREMLKSQDIEPCLMHRLRKGDPERCLKAQLNKAYSSVRSKVERTFGTFKRTYGWNRVRYIGEAKNQVFLFLVSIAFNLRRALSIEAGRAKMLA